MHKYIVLILVAIIFSSCKQSLWKEGEQEQYIDEGKTIAQATAKRMLGEVGKNMKEGGVAQAAPYCHAHAAELTEEEADKNNVTIKRTSHLLRNPENAPNAAEQKIIDTYQAQMASGSALKPMLEKDTDGTVHFYAPIKLQEKCTVCHGQLGETLSKENYATIQTLYPEDKAIGFSKDDLRGIWHITFDKE